MVGKPDIINCQTALNEYDPTDMEITSGRNGRSILYAHTTTPIDMMQFRKQIDLPISSVHKEPRD